MAKGDWCTGDPCSPPGPRPLHTGGIHGHRQYSRSHRQHPDDPAEGMKLKNPMITWIAESSKGDIESFNESMYGKMGFAKAPDETFLGKTCKVMKGKMGKVLTWNGILMMLDMKIMGRGSHQEATKIQTNVPVDAKYFVVPKNTEFSEMPMF